MSFETESGRSTRPGQVADALGARLRLLHRRDGWAWAARVNLDGLKKVGQQWIERLPETARAVAVQGGSEFFRPRPSRS